MKRFLAILLCGVLSVTMGIPTFAAATVDKIALTSDGCNVRVEKSSDGQFHYNYDSSKFKVTATTEGSLLKIDVTKVGSGSTGLMDMVIIQIPNQEYSTITAIGNQAGIAFPAGINANYILTNNNGSISVGVGANYTKNINLDCTGGSGSVVFESGAANYTLLINPNSAAISTNFPNYIPHRQYTYTDGSGTAKITLNITSSSFSVLRNS